MTNPGIILTDIIPDETSIFWKKGRLKTFNNWPFQSPGNLCTPDRMAAAGFHVIGGEDSPDLVECFICGKQLDGWEPEDDPWKEHKKHQSSCKFVELHKEDEKLWTVAEMFDLIKSFIIKTCEYNLEVEKQRLQQDADAMMKSIPSILRNTSKKRK